MRNVLVVALLTAQILPIATARAGNAWSGPYAGISLNYSDAETTIVGNRYTYNQNQAINRVEHDYQGGAISGFAGWNWQQGSIVYGGEVSLGFSDLRSNLVFNSDNDIDNAKIDWTGAAVGRLGYTFANSLLYAKAGLGFANFRNVGGDVNNGGLTLSDAHTREKIVIGPTVGFGYENLVSRNWLVRVEISQVDFAKYAFVNQDGVPGSQFYRIDNGPVRTLGIGLIHKF